MPELLLLPVATPAASLWQALRGPGAALQLLVIAVPVLRAWGVGRVAGNTLRQEARARGARLGLALEALAALLPALVAALLLLLADLALVAWGREARLVGTALGLALLLLLVRAAVHLLVLLVGPHSWVSKWEGRLTLVAWLAAAFQAAGGVGLEVSLAGLSPQVAARLATHARRHGLAGSVGSDFHEPGLPWRPLGRLDKLPEGIEPIAARLVARRA